MYLQKVLGINERAANAWQGENDNKPRMAWNAHAQLYTINS